MDLLVGLIGLGLAAPGILDVIFRAGQVIEKRTYRALHLEELAQNYRKFGTELSRGQLYTQIQIVTMALKNITIPAQLTDELQGCFRKMIECLLETEKEISAIENYPIRKAFKAFFGRRLSLDSRIEELTKQQDLFARLAQLIHIQQTGPSPKNLDNQVRLRYESQDSQAGLVLRDSTIRVADCDLTASEIKEVVVERKPYNPISKSVVENDVKYLTSRLQQGSSTASIMKCLGYRQNPFEAAFDILFELPGNPDRRSLAYMLRSDPQPSLSQRVELCKQLADAISAIHGIGLVHKSVRPYSILIVGHYTWKKSTQALFLTDWTLVRNIDGASTWTGEEDWQRAIYQHPTRQGRQAESKYTIKHDMYSLGICMLEILLWQPFIVCSDPSNENSTEAISEHFQQRAIELGDEGIPKRYFDNEQKWTRKPAAVRRVMVDICETELPACAGNTLSEIVKKCLCCLDNDTEDQNANGGNNLESGLDYISDVLVALGKVSI